MNYDMGHYGPMFGGGRFWIKIHSIQILPLTIAGLDMVVGIVSTNVVLRFTSCKPAAKGGTPKSWQTKESPVSKKELSITIILKKLSMGLPRTQEGPIFTLL